MSHSLLETNQEEITQPSTRAEQVRIIYAAVPSSLIVILVNSIILSAILWNQIDQKAIYLWLIATNLLSLVRYILYRRFLQLEPGQSNSRLWYKMAITISALSGATWGAAGILLFNDSSVAHQVFLAFVIAGMSAGAIATLSAIRRAAVLFVLSAVTPITIKFLMTDTAIGLGMGFMSMIFITMMLISINRLSNTIIDTLTAKKLHEISESKVRYQALYDDLTRLPNRRHLLDTLRQEMSNAERHNRIGAALFIDLDRFKRINDSLGHSVGDELLLQIAQRIRTRLRDEDTAARLGGDEFVVLLPEVGPDINLASAQATKIANKIRRLFHAPFNIQGNDIFLSISVGIALFPQKGVGPDDLIQYADVAMYQAKNEGRDCVRLFSSELQEEVNTRHDIEIGLHQALENNNFEVYYQPQYNSDHHISGAEALVRWNRTEANMVLPSDFIEIAEQTGLIVPIGDLVLRKSCELIAQLGPESGLMISVNISSHQFKSLKFANRIERILLETGADPKKLKLEITEGMVANNLNAITDTMTQIKNLGASFSINDFGTGYSSLAFLNKLPVSELKLDESFVRDISNNSENHVIVETIIFMAQNLGLDIVAVGVETLAELDYLKQKQGLLYQGNYLSKPLPREEFVALIESLDNKPISDNSESIHLRSGDLAS